MVYIKKNKGTFLFLIGFFILFSMQNKMISNTLPYSINGDEGPFIAKPIKMIKTGDFNPHFFKYPTLPLYLATVGTTIGFLKSASRLEIGNPKDISTQMYPYFKHPEIIKYPKLLFVALSSLLYLFLVQIVKNIYPDQKWIYLAIPILFVSSEYMGQSWGYMNVNIVGAFFIISTLLYLLINKETDTMLAKVIFPSLLVGAAIASKYNFFLLAAPVMLTIFIYSREHKLFKLLLVIPVSLVTFVILVPYSVLDFSNFLTDVAFEVWHYKNGHTGFDGRPGIEQFSYYLHSIIWQFTAPLTLFGIIGLINTVKEKPKEFLIIISFPLLLILFMSTQKVHFLRNMISIYAIYSIFIFIGIVFVADKLRMIKSRRVKIASFLIMTLLFIPSASNISHNLVRLYTPDSRHMTTEWIKENIPKNSKIFIANDLNMETSKINADYDIGHYERDSNLTLKSDEYILFPIYGYDTRRESGRAKAAKYNERFKRKNLNILIALGENPVLINYHIMVPIGDPSICIAKLK